MTGLWNGSEFWDSSYKAANSTETFDWVAHFADVGSIIGEATNGNLDMPILHVGCGNSALTEEMYDLGYHRIVNIDISSVAIDIMLKRNGARAGMQWLVMDATRMTFPDCSFGLVLDKTTLDGLVCADDARAVVAAYLREVTRVLSPDGAYLCASCGAPDRMLRWLDPRLAPPAAALSWSVRHASLPASSGGGEACHVYVCRPRGGPPPAGAARPRQLGPESEAGGEAEERGRPWPRWRQLLWGCWHPASRDLEDEAEEISESQSESGTSSD